MEEALRQLERDLARDPSSGRARVVLASALARAGRLVEGLRALDLALVSDAELDDARAYSEELWRAALVRLERVASIPVTARAWVLPRIWSRSVFDAGSSTVLVHGRGPDLGTLVVADVATGRELLRDESKAWSSRVLLGHGDVGDPFFGTRGGWFALLAATRELVHVARSGDEVAIERRTVPFPAERPRTFGHDASLVGAAPAGDRLLLHDAGRRRSVVVRWPSLALEQVVPGESALADWDGGAIVRAHYENGRAWIEEHPLDGSPARRHRELRSERLSLLGPRTLACRDRDLEVQRTDGLRPTRVLVPCSTRRPPASPSLARDGRWLRVVVRGRPRAFLLDLDEARVVEATPATWRLSRHRLPDAVEWHPRSDVVASRGQVRALDGTLLRDLGAGVTRVEWSPDGTACVTWRDAAKVFEVWSVS